MAGAHFGEIESRGSALLCWGGFVVSTATNTPCGGVRGGADNVANLSIPIDLVDCAHCAHLLAVADMSL